MNPLRRVAAAALLAGAPFFAAFAQSTSNVLVVHVEPGAEVTWEGTRLGTVGESGSMTIEGPPEGTFTLLLRKDGFLDLEREVRILAGRNEIDLRLEAVARTPPDDGERPSAPVVSTLPEEPEETAGTTPSEQAPRRETPEVGPFEAGGDGGDAATEAESLPPGPQSEPSAAAEDRSVGKWPLAAGAALMALIAAALLWRRRAAVPDPAAKGGSREGARQSLRTPTPSRAEPAAAPTIQHDRQSDEFLAQLRRREHDIEQEEAGNEVIEAEVLEVWEENET